ncbi:MAG: hypothetical protein VKJ06_05615, partial [Vampirovibrionales bacterium]|nr:hypothetical protein [Vampirovibrionales bacterium]
SQAQQAWAQSYTGAPWLKTTDELKTLFKLAQHQDAFWPAHWVTTQSFYPKLLGYVPLKLLRRRMLNRHLQVR